MNNMLLKLYVKSQALKDLLNREEGQDLIEYALLAALIALAATAMITNVGSEINTIFTNISTSLANAGG